VLDSTVIFVSLDFPGGRNRYKENLWNLKIQLILPQIISGSSSINQTPGELEDVPIILAFMFGCSTLMLIFVRRGNGKTVPAPFIAVHVPAYDVRWSDGDILFLLPTIVGWSTPQSGPMDSSLFPISQLFCSIACVFTQLIHLIWNGIENFNHDACVLCCFRGPTSSQLHPLQLLMLHFHWGSILKIQTWWVSTVEAEGDGTRCAMIHGAMMPWQR